MASKSTHLTAAALSTLAGLHVAWGRGSSFPFATRGELADAVVGAYEVPGPGACYVVASALAAAAAVLENVPPLPARPRRLGLRATAGIIGLRGVVGLAGRTALVSPGSSSPRFVRLDQRVYSPLCLGLAAGTWHASRQWPPSGK
jgi:Protein of unknown function (DUF3995)